MKIIPNIFGAYSTLAEQVIEEFLGLVLKPNMDISDISEVYSDKLDDIIRIGISKELKYVGGVFNICCVDDVSFVMSCEMYFQNKSKEWIKKEAKSKPQAMSYLNKEAQKELKKAKKISFEINSPKL